MVLFRRRSFRPRAGSLPPAHRSRSWSARYYREGHPVFGLCRLGDAGTSGHHRKLRSGYRGQHVVAMKFYDGRMVLTPGTIISVACPLPPALLPGLFPFVGSSGRSKGLNRWPCYRLRWHKFCWNEKAPTARSGASSWLDAQPPHATEAGCASTIAHIHHSVRPLCFDGRCLIPKTAPTGIPTPQPPVGAFWRRGSAGRPAPSTA
jgi:hypothetical protein